MSGTESEVIEHDVDVADASISEEGFGILAIAGYHTYWSERVRAFNEPDEMTVSPYNMPTTHAIYKAAAKAMSQDPAPTQFKVIKLLGAITHRVELVPSTPTAGEVYSLDVDGVPVTVTADGTPTAAEINAALTTAISALTDVTATDGTTKTTVVGDTAGVVHSYENLSSNLKLTETTALPSPAPSVDLAAADALDEEWYGLSIVNGGEASANDAAAWVETKKKLFVHVSADAGCKDGSVTTDIASDLNGASYKRSGVIYHEKPATEFAATAWLGLMLPMLPGPATWANKGLSGVTMSQLDATARGVLKTKKCNYYIPIKKLGFTLQGRAASGRFFDITALLDWFDVGVTNRIVLMLRNNRVVPYTAKGIELARAQVLGQIQEGIGLGLIDGEQKYDATAPALASVNPNDKAERTLDGLGYYFTTSGAVHKVKIKGKVKV